MASSLRCGVEALPEAVVGTLVVLADQPHVDAPLLDALIDAAREASTSIAASAYAGTVGPPAYFARTHFSDLSRLEGDHGAKALLAEYSAAIARVDFPLGAVDLDTREDFARF